MKRVLSVRLAFALPFLLFAVSADKAEPPRPTAAQLGGVDRYLAHVSTDKPIYRAGDKVYVRSVLLHAFDRSPLAGGHISMVKITDPKGAAVFTAHCQMEDSVAGCAWEVPEGQAGGEYKAEVTHPHLGVPPARRNFDIRAYRPPRLNTQILFLRKGYGAGETVTASLTVKRAEGGVPAGAPVTLVGRVDGSEVFRGRTTVSPEGRAVARFDLPGSIERGEGSLAFVIEDGGVVETATKTIPILLQTVDLSFYPEGGDLVAGLANRVYFEARLPNGKPADLAGTVVDGNGAEVAAFASRHEGRGHLAFTPAEGRSYRVRIDKPAGIERTFDLPDAKAVGAVLQAVDEVAEDAVRLRVASRGFDEPLTVTLAQRERELARTEVPADGLREVSLQPTNAVADGVLIATVWNGDTPVAERLVYRRPQRSIQVEVTAEPDPAVPGGEAKVTVRTTDEDGKPVAAVVGLTATDESVLEMIDKREQAPRLPVMVMLEPEVRDLADAHVYLDPEHEDADAAVDLLLGTQGWRRFATVNLKDFLAGHGTDARRALALRASTVRDFGAAGNLWMVDRLGEFDDAEFRRKRVPKAPAVPAPEEPVAAPAPAHAPDPQPVPAPANQPVPAAAEPMPPATPPVLARAKEQLAQLQDRELQEALEKAAAREIAADALFEADLARRPAQPFVFVTVREYAHPKRERAPGQRSDFTETVYWHAGLKTGEDGVATVSFHLSDAVTRFRVFADAFDGRGALGAGSGEVVSMQPFYIEAKMPLEVTQGDRVTLPVTLVNNTTEAIDGARVSFDGAAGKVTGELGEGTLAAHERQRRLLPLEIGGEAGEHPLVFESVAGPYRERLTRPMRVVPRGFPASFNQGALLPEGGVFRTAMNIPDTLVLGSAVGRFQAFPTPLANLQDSLQGLIRQPNGCFEQTSSSTYPLIMAQQYFLSHPDVDPELVRRSEEMLAAGYQRLVGYECKQGGFEWFGADPGHEALTAYGLLEFSDMAKVRQVDGAMIDRSREWLLGRRDGQGGFKRERRALHTWIEDRDCSNAYITWALLESGEPPPRLADEVAHVIERGKQSDNGYVTALAALVAQRAGEHADADALCERLAKVFERDAGTGSLGNAATTIVGSGGLNARIEATALAALAWLPDPDRAGFVQEAIAWLNEQNRGGRFGTTQGTVLALRAIVAFDKASSRVEHPGALALVVNGQPLEETVAFGPDSTGILVTPDFSHLLKAGENTFEVRMAGGSELPGALSVEWHDEQPATSADCALTLEAGLRDAEIAEGEVTEIAVRVVNKRGEAVPSPMAIVGLPGGLEPDHDQLKELVEAGTIAAYEVLGRDVVCYRRDLGAGAEWTFPVRVVAAIPGTYTGPASRAYLYYDDAHKHWRQPLQVSIAPKQNAPGRKPVQ